MLKIIDDKIYLVRGDDEAITVNLDSGGEVYEMQDGDTITLTVREVPSADSPVLFAVSSISNRIVIRHEDTAALEYGAYSADVQINLADGTRRTVWPTNIEDSNRAKQKNIKNFILCSEVTMI